MNAIKFNRRFLRTLLCLILFSTAKLQASNKRPNPLIKFITGKQKEHKRKVAAALAFPLPFGILGLHRLYLGTKSHVPVVYIATLGGCVGVLPTIDFVLILSKKDLSRYEKNDKIFMWVEHD